VTGIVWLHSQYKLSDVKDGLSCTYMAGEKYVDLDAARSGQSWGDDEGPFVSGDGDTVRWAALPLVSIDATANTEYLRPHRDTRGNPANPNDPGYGIWGNGCYNFGSAHSSGFNMALCDGSVHQIIYEISEIVHRRLCNRNDGAIVQVPD
jgi:prepilin-type processing-associated H-X9-DG protein